MQATEAQCDYISILFVDCNFTREQRKAWLHNRFGETRQFAFLDELTKSEAHAVIDELKLLKEGRSDGLSARAGEYGD